MKKKVIGLIALTICFVGCGNKVEKKNSIVGKWAQGSYIYTFNEDNTCSYGMGGAEMKCTYKVDGDKLSITYEGMTAAFETTYSIDGDTLNVLDSAGKDTLYTRK